MNHRAQIKARFARAFFTSEDVDDAALVTTSQTMYSFSLL